MSSLATLCLLWLLRLFRFGCLLLSFFGGCLARGLLLLRVLHDELLVLSLLLLDVLVLEDVEVGASLRILQPLHQLRVALIHLGFRHLPCVFLPGFLCFRDGSLSLHLLLRPIAPLSFLNSSDHFRVCYLPVLADWAGKGRSLLFLVDGEPEVGVKLLFGCSDDLAILWHYGL